MSIASRESRRGFIKLGVGMLVLGGTAPPAYRATARLISTPMAMPSRGDATPASSPSATPDMAKVETIGMTLDLRFDPEEIRIPPGTTITWLNDSPMPHTATGDPEQNPVAETHPEYIALPEGAEPWGSDLLQPGESYSHTFTVPGEYRYICIPHVLSGMRGTIRVED